MANPFRYGLEVSGKQFYDRVEAEEKLYRRLAGGAGNIVMYAPRRYGKTSLVKRVLARFHERRTPTVYFDLNKVESLEKFCEEYASALCSIAGKISGVAQMMKTHLSHLHPAISFGGDLAVTVKFDYGTKMTAQSLSSVLDLAEKVAQDLNGRRIVVAFDEFQEIGRLSPDIPLEGVFRSCIQAHEHVRYVFFGSKTHILARMFGDKERPFYKSASIMKLAKPPRDESIAFVKSRFAECSIIVDDDVARSIVDTAENIPHYIQQLSSIIYEIALSDGRDCLEADDIKRATKELIAENADYYAERLASLSISQRLLVSALARDPVKSFKEQYRRRHSLGGSSTVNTALKVILDAGIVESEESGYFIGDPFFARYVRSSAVSVNEE